MVNILEKLAHHKPFSNGKLSQIKHRNSDAVTLPKIISNKTKNVKRYSTPLNFERNHLGINMLKNLDSNILSRESESYRRLKNIKVNKFEKVKPKSNKIIVLKPKAKRRNLKVDTLNLNYSKKRVIPILSNLVNLLEPKSSTPIDKEKPLNDNPNALLPPKSKILKSQKLISLSKFYIKFYFGICIWLIASKMYTKITNLFLDRESKEIDISCFSDDSVSPISTTKAHESFTISESRMNSKRKSVKSKSVLI